MAVIIHRQSKTMAAAALPNASGPAEASDGIKWCRNRRTSSGVGRGEASPHLSKGKRVQSGITLYAVQPDADVGRSWLRLRLTGCRTTQIQMNEDA